MQHFLKYLKFMYVATILRYDNLMFSVNILFINPFFSHSRTIYFYQHL